MTRCCQVVKMTSCLMGNQLTLTSRFLDMKVVIGFYYVSPFYDLSHTSTTFYDLSFTDSYLSLPSFSLYYFHFSLSLSLTLSLLSISPALSASSLNLILYVYACVCVFFSLSYTLIFSTIYLFLSHSHSTSLFLYLIWMCKHIHIHQTYNQFKDSYAHTIHKGSLFQITERLALCQNQTLL